MPFRTILQQLVDDLDGTIGALFLDWEGEAVGLVGAHHERYDLHLIGAYQGIFLSRLERVAENLALGRLQTFRIGCENAVFFNCTLTEGYYLVLIVDPEVPDWLAWDALSKGRERLLEEMG